MKTKVKLSILLLLIMVVICYDAQKKEGCPVPPLEKCAAVGSNATLLFPVDSRVSVTESLWTWTINDSDLCFCRNGHLNFADFPHYKSRIKVDCKNLVKENGSITVTGVQEADKGLYTLRHDIHTCIGCVNFAVASNEANCKEAEIPRVDNGTVPSETVNSKTWTIIAVGAALAFVGIATTVSAVVTAGVGLVVFCIYFTVQHCKTKHAPPSVEEIEMENLNTSIARERQQQGQQQIY